MNAVQKTILAVDDERDIIDMLTLLLESEGYRVVPAMGGTEAIEILEKETPDLVLLDIMMPDLDGHAVCRHIRAQEKFADLPVVMLTAKNDIDHIALALDEGADGFIVKPFEVDQFLRMLGFRVAGRHAEFYRSDRPVVQAEEMPAEKLASNERIVFLDFFEPDDAFSAVVRACEEQSHCLLSLWQKEADENTLETTVLLTVESSAQFGDMLNRILEVPDVRIANCIIYRNFSDIPADIMHGGE